MKLSNSDIGGEIISIITKGMYTDPKDALREYVQNGVDAGARKIEIKIRQNVISIQDNGKGMTRGVMRRAVRVGMSDKNPKFSVGFMGIGLYSAFHLCDILTIYSKVEDSTPNKLVFYFKNMRNMLDEQKAKRIKKRNLLEEDNTQVSLLPLLEQCVDFVEIEEDGFAKTGTRVEMSGVEQGFYETLSKFEEISEYLEKVVPLPFDPEFKYGKDIQTHINNVCRIHGGKFKIVELYLDINGKGENLYRPYKDSDFSNGPQPPNFKELKSDDDFFGVAWGCLNSSNEVIADKFVRGFILRKQGFALGAQNALQVLFGARFFNRYVGEIIVVHPHLLPNGARNDFEYSNLRNSFYRALDDVAAEYNADASRFQEQQKAEQELNRIIKLYRKRQGELRSYENDSNKLLDTYKELTTAKISFDKRMRVHWKIRPTIQQDAEETMNLLSELITHIKTLIEVRRNEKKSKPTSIAVVASKLNQAPKPRGETQDKKIPTSLSEVVELIGNPFSNEIKQIFDLLEERYIRPSSTNQDDFIDKLVELKSDIEDLFTEE